MADISFFTPISYGNQPKSTSMAIRESVDDYFYLGGRKAFIIPSRVDAGKEAIILSEGSPSFLLSALKVASYLTIIIPIVALIVKAVLRGNMQFHLIDPKSELEKNFVIAPNLIEKIQQLMPAIERKENNPEIQWISKVGTSVFRLTGAPQLVFKTNNGKALNGAEQIRNRFENMIKAKEVCLAHQLDLMTIPQAKIFNVEAQGKILPVIAEQSIDIRPSESVQEELYKNCAQGLNRTMRQLSTFIAKTGFNDVTWRNIPIQDYALPFQGDRRVALIDFEHMETSREGFLGSSNGSCGLVRCLFSEEQIDAVLAEAVQEGIITQQAAQESKQERMEEIRLDRQLREFYQRKGILSNQQKSLEVDVETLGLDLDETKQVSARVLATHGVNNGSESGSQRVTMREVAEATIAAINRSIQRPRPDDEPVKSRRRALLEGHHSIFAIYRQFRSPSRLSSNGSKEVPWLRQIINALIAKGHLFRLIQEDNGGYVVQA